MKLKGGLRVFLYDPSGGGGICHYTFQLAQHLVQLGNDVTVITNQDYELHDLQRSFTLKILFKKSWVKSCAVWLMSKIHRSNGRKILDDETNTRKSVPETTNLSSLIRILKTLRLLVVDLKLAVLLILGRPHVVHFQLVNRHEDYLFIKLLKFLRFRIVYTVHDVLPHDSESADDRDGFQKIYERLDSIIVHSNNNKQEMIRLFNIDGAMISVIPHGSNNLFFTDGNITKESARQEIGIPHDKKAILFFGLIQRYKGLEYLIQAFEEVKANISEAVLVIAGRINNRDPEEFRYYSSLVDQLRERCDVICINEYFPYRKVNFYFSASDVVVLPYIKTYTSGVLLTAYAAGKPVVVTDTGGLSEVVQEGKSGYTVPAKDIKGLAQAIIRVIKNKNQTAEMGRYAKYLAETEYSWQRIALRTTDVYQSLLLGSGPSHAGNVVPEGS